VDEKTTNRAEKRNHDEIDKAEGIDNAKQAKKNQEEGMEMEE